MAHEIRVLIVDDDENDARLAKIALGAPELPCYEHHHAVSIERAFECLESHVFDIVLLDLDLPRFKGIETLEQFRSKEDRLPVIVLSGLEDEAVATQALERGAQDYLFKADINARNLPRAIRYAIQRQASVLENRQLLRQVKENEEVLQQKNERLRHLYETAHAFVDNVSHEFRTPLTVIKEYVSLVRDGTMGAVNDEQARYLRIVEDRADDLNTMVDDMLDVSKLEAGMLNVRRNAHRVNDIVDRVLASLTQKAAIRELTLEVSVDPGLPEVYCDGEKVERVIINLAVNAMKFTRPGGNVRIWAAVEDTNVVVGVTDNGPGIAEECLRSIFERFQQVNLDVRSSTKGFGLGLNIARELVALNLGEMRVESKLQVGSTFSFTLPRDCPLEIAQRFVEKTAKAADGPMSLLVAELNPNVSSNSADDIDVFLSHLVRGSDLSFRAARRRWVLLVPELESEALAFAARAQIELQSINRNRPKGQLPELAFRLDGTWSNLGLTQEEILGRVSTHLKEFEAMYA